ncbi:DUF3892 domain-containing protein [Bradyrhizobium elkanii]|uniref:DUF3892 domain-containing protein n=1 Tax=Bradyrhizobium elkanii TaxID=29448 RepID=UPI00084174BC|nr:DUF3892 domain-containing protein [Bradyrhizobium elkanii]ODM73114.1 hypothetical protein A6X20_38805 [Bradyrhizobium elkanii]ODM76864.1 hypothetical protein A6452_01515 [Bradyrhizobium elkanii]
MAKWADYVITAVRFNDKHTHIDRVRAWKDNGESLETVQEFTRQTIVKAINDDGITFVTAFKTTDGKWRKGEDVFVIHIHNVAYIKTKRDNTTRDNLDNLPEF